MITRHDTVSMATISTSVAPVRPTTPATRPRSPASPGPITSFEGLSDDGTKAPPDTDGAIGPNHVMTALNSQLRIQNRSGAILLVAALNDFWRGAPGIDGNPLSPNAFDPRVRYDPQAQRWVFAAVNPVTQSPRSALLIAVSQSPDPTGSWNRYAIQISSTGVSWGDYTNVGFTSQSVVATVNLNRWTDNADLGAMIVVLDKQGLVSGAAVAVTTFADGSASTLVPALTYDNDAATLYLVENWRGASQQLRIARITGAAGSAAYAIDTTATLSTGAWADRTALDHLGFAPQLGSANKIDTFDARMHSVVYRNGSLWVAQTVFPTPDPATVAPTRSSAQWAQLSVDGAVIQQGRVDDPTGARFFAFPSLAVNVNNDVLLGYASFSASQYGSGNYAIRAAADPPGTLRGDTLYRPGVAPYTRAVSGGDGTSNRWGDYSTTVVDPADDTSMWTLQEYAATPAGGIDRWGVWWAQLQGISPAAAATHLSFASSDPTLAAGFFSSPMTVQLSEANGDPVQSGPDGIQVALTTTSTGGTFHPESSASTINQVTIAPGHATAALRYRDTVVGDAALSGTAPGLGPATLTPHIAAGTAVAAVTGADGALYIKPYPQSFQSLGGYLVGAPAVVSVPHATGPVSTMYIGTGSDHRLYVRTDTADWQDLVPGQPLACYDNPAAAVTTQGAALQLTVACEGGDRALYYWQVAFDDTSIPTLPPAIATPYRSLGGAVTAGPAIGTPGGVLTFVGLGTDQRLYSRTIASSYLQLGAACHGHPAITGGPANPYLACQGLDGAAYISRFTGTDWGPFRSTGGALIDGPGLALTTAGVTLLAEGLDRRLYRTTVSLDGLSSDPFTSDGGVLLHGAAGVGVG